MKKGGQADPRARHRPGSPAGDGSPAPAQLRPRGVDLSAAKNFWHRPADESVSRCMFRFEQGLSSSSQLSLFQGVWRDYLREDLMPSCSQISPSSKSNAAAIR